MEVFLIRHAEAADETHELRDADRPLTERGRAQAAHLGDRLRWHDCTPTRILSSPYVRAVETAELIAGVIAATLPIEREAALEPGKSVDTLVTMLRRTTDDVILVFGHEPSLSLLGSHLLGASLGMLARAEAVRICAGQLRWRFAWDAEAPMTRI